jgi:hypothetical protein
MCTNDLSLTLLLLFDPLFQLLFGLLLSLQFALVEAEQILASIEQNDQLRAQFDLKKK